MMSLIYLYFIQVYWLIFISLQNIKMKNYIICDDVYCSYLARDKKDLIKYIKHRYNKNSSDYIESLKDINLRFIKYNSKKIQVDNFFWDLIAIDKKDDDEIIDYDNYSKYWIKDWICKKDFLYHNL